MIVPLFPNFFQIGSRHSELIVIDEVQKIPELFTEVHWPIENSGNRFLLTGSSTRKLRRSGGTNLAGRLKTVHLHPLTYTEIPGFNLLDRLQYGSLSPIVLVNDPWGDLKDYGGEYLKEEILAEGLVRNIPAFSRFLEPSALSNSEQLNYATIARNSGASDKTGEFGKTFEHFLVLETIAAQSYGKALERLNCL